MAGVGYFKQEKEKKNLPTNKIPAVIRLPAPKAHPRKRSNI
jgi:hypothetical protein